MDAAFRSIDVFLDVIARDCDSILHFWTKVWHTTDPAISQAIAIDWALKLAKLELFQHVIIESDVKISIDDLNGVSLIPQDFHTLYKF